MKKYRWLFAILGVAVLGITLIFGAAFGAVFVAAFGAAFAFTAVVLVFAAFGAAFDATAALEVFLALCFFSAVFFAIQSPLPGII